MEKLFEIPDLFSIASGMLVNVGKSTIYGEDIEEEETYYFITLLPYNKNTIDEGLKYLRFKLTPSSYDKKDWD